ncbi:MAG: PQQ-binding-like beta-propeller repeat protein [Candidatus Bathyarchaeota archaeon]|nr:PQQ-binding-like beta-propeller repeat protein [Candidatus Bathyarchaeota archaeon]
MEKQKIRTLLTAILILTIALATLTSIAFAQQINYNPDMGTVTKTAPAYMTSDNSAYAAAAEYGNLMQEEYAWHDPHANIPQRTGYNPGPAPDRPDVLWRTQNNAVPKVILGTRTLGSSDGLVNPTLASFSGAPMAMDGQLIAYGSIRPNSGNSTTRNAVISLNPHTGAVNWASIVGYGAASAAGVGASFGVASYIFKVDDTHFGTLAGGMFGGGGGFCMFRTTGEFLWIDGGITPGAVYHSCIVAPDPVYMIFGPQSFGEYTNHLCGWDLSDPETDKGSGNRLAWQYLIDEPGSNPLLAYGDGKVFMGSYSSVSVYAVDAETGDKVWETYVKSAMGYMTCYADGKVYVGCQSMHIYALDGDTGEVVWHNIDGTANRAFNVWNINYAYDRIYIHDLGFGSTGAQKCLDADTGEALWASQALFWIGYYRTVMADGKIYGRQSDQSTTTGREAIPTNFACWDAYTGEVLWEINEEIAGPIIAYGCLYYIEGAGYGDTGNQLVALSTAVGQPDDWAMFRGNAENPGFTMDKGPTDISSGPKWTFTTGAGITSSPIASEGRVYVNSGDGNTYCVDAYTGMKIWEHATQEPTMTHFGSTPAIADGKIYVGPDDGYFYILNADTGSEIKSIPMGTYRPVQVQAGQHNIKSSPIISGGRVYIASVHNGLLYALDMNGNTQWTVDVNGDGSPIVGSVAIEDNYIYIMDWSGNVHKYDLNGNELLSFPTDRSGDSFWSSFFGPVSYTPTVVGDLLWIGGTNNRLRAYDVNNGSIMYSGVQPNVEGETSHGSATYVPGWAMVPRDINGSDVEVNEGYIISQFGPTVACARADNGDNIWSNWGGWEVWSTPVFAGIGESAVVYYGSDSAGIQVVDAASGISTSWFTAQGNIVGSPAVWDGKLYVGSYDNNLYCFEDHNEQEMAASISTDKVSMAPGDTVTITMQLTKVPDINVYEEIGREAPVPGLPDADVLVTFTDPDGVEHDVSATTDKLGWATATYTPDTAGTWKVIAWYMGEDHPTFSYGYAFSTEVELTVSEALGPVEPLVTSVTPMTTEINVGESAVLTASASGGAAPFTYQWYKIVSGTPIAISGETSATLAVAPDTEGTYGYFCEITDAATQVDSSDTAQVKVFAEGAGGGIPMEYIYAIIAVIVIVIVLVVVYMVMKKRK